MIPAEYERKDYQARALPGTRILARSVSGQAAGPAATSAGRVGGLERPAGRWPAGGCVLAVVFYPKSGSGGSGPSREAVTGAGVRAQLRARLPSPGPPR